MQYQKQRQIIIELEARIMAATSLTEYQISARVNGVLTGDTIWAYNVADAQKRFKDMHSGKQISWVGSPKKLRSS